MKRAGVFLVALLLSACNQDGGDPADVDVEARTLVFDCAVGAQRLQVVARVEGDVLHVWLPPDIGGPYLRLAAEGPAGSYRGDRARVQLGDDTLSGSVEVRASGAQGAHALQSCRHDRRASIWEHAKLSGVDFRGVGNEPGWTLEIRESDRIDFVWDYGSRRLSVPITQRLDGDRETVFLAGTEAAGGPPRLQVTLSPGPCPDTMSDETFSTRVSVLLDERAYRGCGEPLH